MFIYISFISHSWITVFKLHLSKLEVSDQQISDRYQEINIKNKKILLQRKQKKKKFNCMSSFIKLYKLFEIRIYIFSLNLYLDNLKAIFHHFRDTVLDILRKPEECICILNLYQEFSSLVYKKNGLVNLYTGFYSETKEKTLLGMFN